MTLYLTFYKIRHLCVIYQLYINVNLKSTAWHVRKTSCFAKNSMPLSGWRFKMKNIKHLCRKLLVFLRTCWDVQTNPRSLDGCLKCLAGSRLFPRAWLSQQSRNGEQRRSRGGGNLEGQCPQGYFQQFCLCLRTRDSSWAYRSMDGVGPGTLWAE